MHIEQKKRWTVAEPVPEAINDALGGYPPVLQQLLYNRGIRTFEDSESYISQSGSMFNPYLLKGMEVTVERLFQAITQEQPIVVYGDYDVDGITATALLVQVLERLGADVSHYIPNRFDEGYGLNDEGIELLKKQGACLVVTVDCGIRSTHEVEYASNIGLDLIISDHHSPIGRIPKALAVINPKQSGDDYPYKDLAGVGIAYKISEALIQKCSIPDIHAEDWLDLVAVGTVADIVPLTGENRALVRAGLKSLRQGRRQGFRSLIGSAGLDYGKITARDIGFVLGPRLNATGRLESAEASYELIMTEDVEIAGVLAQKLDDQNRLRQEQTIQTQLQAEEQAQSNDQICDYLLFAAHPDFSMGLVGLAAARLTEKYYRPSIVGHQGDTFTRASCRSIPEFHITQALDQCSDLLVRHGGHSMAAGFTVDNQNLSSLIFRLQEIATQQLSSQNLLPTLKIDMAIQLRDLRPEILKFLDALEPVGMGNPEALFLSKNLRVLKYRPVGVDDKHLKFSVTDGFIVYDAIAFRQGHWAANMPARVDIVYSYERNVYKDRESLQLNIRDMRVAEIEN